MNAFGKNFTGNQLTKHNSYFILPEFQQFQHTFKRLDPTLIGKLTDANLKDGAKYLEINYRQCLHRLENPTAQLPYNLIITKEWMLVVNRSKPAAGHIHINSLGFLGLLYGANPEQIREIYDKKPLEILSQVAVPVFGRSSNLTTQA